jgi:hypothetical protein
VSEAIPDVERGVFLALGLMGLRPDEAVALRPNDARGSRLTIARAQGQDARRADPRHEDLRCKRSLGTLTRARRGNTRGSRTGRSSPCWADRGRMADGRIGKCLSQ